MNNKTRGIFFVWSLLFLPWLLIGESELPYKPGEIIVKFKNLPPSLGPSFSPQSLGPAATRVKQLLIDNGATEVERLYPSITQPVYQAQAVDGSTVSVPNLYTTTVVKFSTSANVQSLVEIFSASPDVEYAEPNYRRQLSTVPNDPLFSDLWGMQNTGQIGGTQGADIDAVSAWNTTTGSTNVIVAVMDSGVAWDHPDLSANIWVNDDPINGSDDDQNDYPDDLIGWDFGEKDNNPYDSSDDTIDPYDGSDYDPGHGTHVAGTIGAVGNNGIGVTGVAWQIKIMPLKVVRIDGPFISDLSPAYYYAGKNGAKIINASYSGPSYSQAEADVILTIKLQHDVLVVASAGNNDRSQFKYPAAYTNVLAVAATDRNDRKAVFSNYGTWVDVAAPGVAIKSTWWDGTYISISGTSMASPMVAGVAALIRSKYPSLNSDQVRERIENSCDPLPALSTHVVLGLMGRGRVNAAKALAPFTPTNLSGFVLGTSSISWSWNLTEGATGYYLYINGNGNYVREYSQVNSKAIVNLATNTAYGVQVAGVNVAEGALSSLAIVYTNAATPKDVSANNVLANSLILSWDENTNPTNTQYLVSYWAISGSTSTLLIANSTSAILTSLSGGTAYFFQVQGKNGAGVLSAPSAVLSTVTAPLANTVQTVDPGADAVVQLNVSGGMAKVRVPAGSFYEPVAMTVKVPQSVPSVKGNLAQISNTSLEIATDKLLSPVKDVFVTLPYDSSSIAGMNESRLAIARYDENHQKWVELVTVSRDPLNNLVTGKTMGFSIFQVVYVKPLSGLNSVEVGPNPLRPNSTANKEIVFTKLPADSTLKIYTYAGELVSELKADATGMASWDGRNQAGQNVASGVYLVLIEINEDKRIVKVAIER